MTAQLRTLLTAFLVAFPFTPASADDYDDTIKVFRGAGQTRQAVRQCLRLLRGVPDHRQGAASASAARTAQAASTQQGHLCRGRLDDPADGGPAARRPGLQPDHLLREQGARSTNFTSGNFEFGAQATAVAIKSSAGAQAGTTGTSSGRAVPAEPTTPRPPAVTRAAWRCSPSRQGRPDVRRRASAARVQLRGQGR